MSVLKNNLKNTKPRPHYFKTETEVIRAKLSRDKTETTKTRSRYLQHCDRVLGRTNKRAVDEQLLFRYSDFKFY